MHIKSLFKWLYHSGGDVSYVENPDLFEKAKYIMPVYSSQTGFVEGIDSDIVGSIAVYLGAGRMNDEKKIDRSAGIVLQKKIGDQVQAGEIIAYVHTNDENKVNGATQNLESAYKITNKKVMPTLKVIESI